jgi:Zn-dependent peptidase ImmA (M78 family)
MVGTSPFKSSEADTFAGELLVPLEMLKVHVQKGIPELSRIFMVSEQVVGIAISKSMKALFK